MLASHQKGKMVHNGGQDRVDNFDVVFCLEEASSLFHSLLKGACSTFNRTVQDYATGLGWTFRRIENVVK